MIKVERAERKWKGRPEVDMPEDRSFGRMVVHRTVPRWPGGRRLGLVTVHNSRVNDGQNLQKLDQRHTVLYGLIKRFMTGANDRIVKNEISDIQR